MFVPFNYLRNIWNVVYYRIKPQIYGFAPVTLTLALVWAGFDCKLAALTAASESIMSAGDIDALAPRLCGCGVPFTLPLILASTVAT